MVFGCLSFISLYSVYRLTVSLDHSKTVTLKGWGNEFFNVLGEQPYSTIIPSPSDKEGWDEVDNNFPYTILPKKKPS